MDNYLNRIKELEQLFSDNQYDGSGKTAFVIENGCIPIMVSAPHAINQYREGQVKWADMYTGGIARYLHETTGCHLIYSCMFTETDPNYDAPGFNKYQEVLAEYVKENNVILLLDLHGAAKKREYAVEMGTAPEQNQRPGESYEEDPSLHQYKFIDDVIKIIFEDRFKDLSIEQKKVWKNTIFNAGDQNTVTKFISENTNTSCIQLEINGNYRNPNNTDEFVGLIEALTKIIVFFSTLDWNSDPQKIIEKL